MKVDKYGLKQQRMAKVQPDMIFTPSIFVVLFTLDSDPQMSKSELCRQIFAKTPWKLHHLSHLNTLKQSSNRIDAKQEFYELLPDLPLFSVSTTHCGKQILRITVVTYNHSEMAKFYGKIFRQPMVSVRPDFSYCAFTYSCDLTLQFALKSAAGLMPYPTENVDLVLSVNELPTDIELNNVSEDLYTVTDPDDNGLLIRHCKTSASSSNAETSTLHTKHSFITQVVDKGNEPNFNIGFSQPDVIPSQDSYITAQAHRQAQLTSPEHSAVSLRRRSGSPVINRRKLVICSKSANHSGSIDPNSEAESNKVRYKRRSSIDILESF